VYSRAQTKGNTLDETTAMPETNFVITQKTLTMVEFGNSVPYTGKLDNLSQHPVQEIIHRVMKTDCKQTLDIQAWNQFNQTGLKVQAASGTSTTAVTFSTTPGTGSIGITNNVAFGKGHLRPIIDNMKEFNIPEIRGLAA
jgi:hypothetical protein